MHDIVAQVIASKQAGDLRPSVAIAADLRQQQTKDDLVAELANRDAHQVNEALRKAIREEHIRGELTLDLGQLLPSLIETKDGNFKPRDAASVGEVSWHMSNQVTYHATRYGIAQRIQERWLESIDQHDWTDDQIVGIIRWGDMVCSICHLTLFAMSNPARGIEWAHDRPVAAMSGDRRGGWAHGDCNRSEGAR